MLWPPNCPQLKVLDSLFQCRICYDLIKHAQMTTCSHNFCSFCIRQHLTFKTECPACFLPMEETKLRPNKILDDIVNIYPPIKEFIANLSVKRTPVLASPSEPNSNIPTAEHVLVPETVDESQDFGIQPSAKKRSLVLDPSTNDKDTKDYTDFQPSCPKKALRKSEQVSASTSTSKQVLCPVCNISIKTSIINIHLDACLKQKEETKAPTRSTRKPRPLTKLVYNLMPDKELRKRLKELGLSAQGNRKTLIQRHQRYTVLHNSELDAARPRPSLSLVKQIEREEAAEKELSNPGSKPPILNCNRQTDPAIIEECQQAYVREHHDQFKQLVEEAQARNNSALKKSTFSHLEASEKKDNGKKPEETLNLDSNLALDKDHNNSSCSSPLRTNGLPKLICRSENPAGEP